MKRVFVVLNLLVLAGCGIGAPPEPTLPAALADRTPWQAELTNLETDGTRSLESALALFAMAFGPVPGVQLASVEGTVGSASPAVRAIQAHRDQLTDEQRAAVDRYLTAAEEGTEFDVPTATSAMTATTSSATGLSMSTAVAQPEDPFERDLLKIATRARTRAAYYFGEIPDVVGVGSGPALSIRFMDQPDWNFVSFYVPTPGSASFTCKVFVNSAFATSIAATNRSVTLDITHCYQSWILGTDQGFDGDVPAWAWEGPAEYIMLETLPAQEDDVLWWATYLLLPDVSLFERSYDAVGYYEQAWDAGVDLGDAFKAVLTDVDNPERFALAGTAMNEFLDEWASGHVLDVGWNDDWHFIGPGQPGGVIPPRQSMSISNGSLEAYSQDAYSNHLFAATSTADIVKVEVMGRARVGDGQTDVVVPGVAYFCTTDKGCGPCPDGSDPSIDRTPLSSNFVLAISGGTDGTNGTVSGHPLEEFCDETPPPSDCPDPNAPPDALVGRPLAVVGGLEVAQGEDCETPPPTPDPTPDPDPDPDPDPSDECDDGCPQSNGDPHMITINNTAYDFMAAGEFVLLRNGDGSFELQARQEPVSDSTYVSGNTALAMRLGSSRVGILTDVSTNTLTATIDGSAADLSSPVEVAGGRVSRSTDGIEVTFPDGTRLMAHGSHEFGISLALVPSDALRSSAVGLLGPASPELFMLPALPDGSVLPQANNYEEYQAQVYGVFEDAWRISQATSLFDYAPGTSTDTYTLSDFPALEDALTLDDFPSTDYDAAAAQCASLGNETLMLQCIYDILATGNVGFAEVYEQAATIIETGALPSTGAHARVVNLYSENGQPVDLDVYAWTYSETAMAEVAALVATVPYGQASDWFNPGLIESPFGSGTRVSVERHGDAPELFAPLGATTEFLGPGTTATIAVWQEEGFDGEPDAWVGTTYAAHPDYEIPEATAGNGRLITRMFGLLAEDERPTLYGSVGDGCLAHPLSDPSFPNPQPIANDLAIPVGSHTFTLHEEPGGGIPGCKTKPVGPGVPITVAEGDIFMVFPYRLSSTEEVQTLVLPFAP